MTRSPWSFEEEHRAAIEEALRSGTAPTQARSATGDPARLRGLPMVGGAPGAIPETVPHRNRRLEPVERALAVVPTEVPNRR